MVTEEKGYFSLRTAARGMGATTGELTAEADVQPHMERAAPEAEPEGHLALESAGVLTAEAADVQPHMERAALEVEPEGHLALESEMVATAPGIM